MPIEPAPKPSWRLIINGKCAASELLREAVVAMRRRDCEAISVRVTWERGDAERYVGEAIAEGIDTVVAVGGDGTLSAVAASLAQHESVRLPSLGLVPMGTANDFAEAAQIPTDPAEALALVRRSAAQPIDLLHIESDDQHHWCANLASGGFGTKVTVETDEGLKKMLGGLAYLITGIARLGRIEPVRARILGPGFEWQGDFIALGIGNGRQAGAGQELCPDALIDDGKLDLTIVPELVGEVAATLGTLVRQGKRVALDRVAVREQLPWVELQCDDPMTLNLDGEPLQSTRFRIDCVASRVRMHLPPGCPLLGTPGNPLGATEPRGAADPSSGLVPA